MLQALLVVNSLDLLTLVCFVYSFFFIYVSLNVSRHMSAGYPQRVEETLDPWSMEPDVDAWNFWKSRKHS